MPCFAPGVSKINPRTQRHYLAHGIAHCSVRGPATQVIVQKCQACRAAEKTANTAVEMNQIPEALLPGKDTRAAKIFQIDKPDAVSARTVFRRHNIGLLQVTRVDAGVVHPANLARNRCQDSPTTTRVTTPDTCRTERKSRKAVGIH